MSDTPVTLLDRIAAFFARDKDAYWFHHYTSDEKAMNRMNAWQLAKVIHEANVRNTVDFAEKKIVAEHMLGARLARMQARPNYIALGVAVVVGFGGAYLTSALQKSPEQTKCVCEYQSANTAKNAEPKVKDALVPATPGQPVLGIQQDIKTGADVKNDGKPAEKKKP